MTNAVKRNSLFRESFIWIFKKINFIFFRGQLLKTMGDHLTAELPQCLPIFLDRLKNEITRLTTVKALTMIAGSDLRIDLSVLLNEAFPLMATFLRKSHRGLKLSTLACLDLLVPNYGMFTRNNSRPHTFFLNIVLDSLHIKIFK